MAAYMPDTEKQMQNSTGLSPKAGTAFTEASTCGAMPFFLPSAMILWNVPAAGTKWSSWNFIIITNAYPSKNFMRKQCPNFSESVLLHDFFFYILCYNPLKGGWFHENRYRGITQKIH